MSAPVVQAWQVTKRFGPDVAVDHVALLAMDGPVESGAEQGIDYQRSVVEKLRRIGGEDVAAVYRELLKLWQNADPDVPVVREARVESARLP